MEELKLNCVHVPYNFNTNRNLSLSNSGSEKVNNLIGIGTLTMIFILFLIDVLSVEITKLISRTMPFGGLGRIFDEKILMRSIVLTLLVITLPLSLIFYLFAFLYRQICCCIIRAKDKDYVKYLDSFDVFWCLEESNANSIIDILGIIESESPQKLINKIKEKLKSIIPNKDTEKIFYRKTEKYGFFYWRKFSSIDIDEYVEMIDIKEKDNLTENDLENLMTNVQKQRLPYKDEGLFKILVTKQRVNSVGKKQSEYGIVFRINHAIGDGVALMNFFCEIFADKPQIYAENTVLSPVKTKRKSSINILAAFLKLCEISVCFVDGILRKTDQNALHGPTLTGHKLFKWTAPEENLIKIVKDIKKTAQLSFTDILMAALSNGLQKYFVQIDAPMPEDISVILPIRFPKPASKSILKNDFGVIILDLPMNRDGNLKEIANRSNALKTSADPLTKYFALKFLCYIMPKALLKKIMVSDQATLAFSNLPGPNRVTIAGGDLKSLVFFVPNAGTLGIGITALCYGGDLRFGASADAAIMPNSEYLNLILEGMIEELKRLHRQYVP